VGFKQSELPFYLCPPPTPRKTTPWPPHAVNGNASSAAWQSLS